MKHSKFFLELGNCCEKSITEMYILDKDQKYTSVKIYRNIIHVFTDIDCNGSICDWIVAIDGRGYSNECK